MLEGGVEGLVKVEWAKVGRGREGKVLLAWSELGVSQSFFPGRYST